MAVRSRGVHAGSHARLRFATDDRLVAFVRRGDSAAFEVLYDRHSAALLSFCLYMLGSRHDAEDALQATFASAHKSLLADERPLALRSWLFAIARNACLSILRQRRPWVELNGEPAHGGDPVRELELREEVRQLVEGVLALPERQRAALVLAELHGLSQVEIATVMDVSAEQVKAYAYQARSNLISDREARDTHCRDIREELATARGAALLKRRLRRHLRSCVGCREYQHELSHQRRQFGILLPVVPSLALKYRTLEDLLGNAALPGTSAARVAAGGALAGTAALADGGLKALVAKVGTGLAALGATAGVGAAVLGLPTPREGQAPPTSGASQRAQPLLAASAGPARRSAAPGNGAGAAGLSLLGAGRAGGVGKQGSQPSSATTQLGSPATPSGGGPEAGSGSSGETSSEGNGGVNQPGPASTGEHPGKGPEPAHGSEAERRQKAREQRQAEANKKSEERLRQKEHERQQKSNEQRKSEERLQRKEERQRKSEERQQAPPGRPPGLRGPPPQRREAQREERRKRREERRR